VLPGAGKHRLVAFTTVAAAVVNIALSLALVKSFGLPGVAIGTLVPICIASTLVLFPAGCRRVDLPVGRALSEAVWPAVWPAAVMTAFVLTTRAMVPAHLVAVAAEMAAACVVYAIMFVAFGINRVERRFYLSKATELLRHRTAVPVAEGA
jgi:O-antigen/teichoic acid export membrane protein